MRKHVFVVALALFSPPMFLRAHQEQLSLLGEKFPIEEDVSNWRETREAFVRRTANAAVADPELCKELDVRSVMGKWWPRVTSGVIAPTPEALGSYVRKMNTHGRTSSAYVDRLVDVARRVQEKTYANAPRKWARAVYEWRFNTFRRFLQARIVMDANEHNALWAIGDLNLEKRRRLGELVECELEGERLASEVRAWGERLRSSGLFSPVELEAYEALAAKREAELFPEGRRREWERTRSTERRASDGLEVVRSRLLGILEREAGRALLDASSIEQLDRFDRIMEARETFSERTGSGTGWIAPEALEKVLLETSVFSPEKTRALVAEARDVMADVFPEGARRPAKLVAYDGRLEMLNDALKARMDTLRERGLAPYPEELLEEWRAEFKDKIEGGGIESAEDLVRRWKGRIQEYFGERICAPQAHDDFALEARRAQERLFPRADLEADLKERLEGVVGKARPTGNGGLTLDAVSQAMKDRVLESITGRLAGEAARRDPVGREALLELKEAVESGRIEPFRAGEMLGLDTRMEIKEGRTGRTRPYVRVKPKL